MLCFEFLLLYYGVVMMGKAMGIVFTTICMMWSRVGEDQRALGLVWNEVLGRDREGKKRVLNPATVRRLKAAGLGAGLNILCSFRARKAAGLNLKAAASVHFSAILGRRPSFAYLSRPPAYLPCFTF